MTVGYRVRREARALNITPELQNSLRHTDALWEGDLEPAKVFLIRPTDLYARWRVSVLWRCGGWELETEDEDRARRVVCTLPSLLSDEALRLRGFKPW